MKTVKILRFFKAKAGLGSLPEHIQRAGLHHEIVELTDPTRQPTPANSDALILMGGPMGVYEMEQYPQLKTAIEWIHDAIAQDIPVLGICLGAQLIAKALGADVRKHTVKEIGWEKITFTPVAFADPLFSFSSSSQIFSEWHQDTFDLPAEAELLATSALCKNQAFRFGKKVYALQFHPEANHGKIEEWLTHFAHTQVLEGKEISQEMRSGFEKHGAAQMEWMAEFMDRFFKLTEVPVDFQLA